MSDLSYFHEVIEGGLEGALSRWQGPSLGTFCNFVPEELILATGALPLRLCGGDELAAKHGEDFLPRDCCPLVKSIVGKMSGNRETYRSLSLVIIPSSCDNKAKVGSTLAQFIPTYILSLPRQKMGPGVSEFWQRQIEVLKEKIEEATHVRITRERLKDALQTYNRRQEAFMELFELRKSDPSLISGSDALLITGSSFYAPASEWTDAVIKICQQLREESATKKQPEKRRRRLLLTGAPLIYPNFKIIHSIELCGATVVIDELCSGTERLYHGTIPRDWSMKEMMHAIADRVLLPCTCPCFVDGEDRINRLLELVQQFRVEGVVYHNLRICTPFDMETERVRKALEVKGVPMLALSTDYGAQDTAQLSTRIEAFLEMIS